jgi:phosphoglycolate phosphatase
MAIDAMKACGVEIKNTVLIGDTIYDAQCAANAGISFVGVSWGYNSSDILSQNGARIIVNDFAQLQTSLDDIIPQIG